MIIKYTDINRWGENTRKELEVPDGSKIYKIDYQTVCGYDGHDVYGILIEVFDKKFKTDEQYDYIKLGKRSFVLISQIILDDESILSDIDTCSTISGVYLTSKHKDNINYFIEKFISIPGEEIDIEKLNDAEEDYKRFKKEGNFYEYIQSLYKITYEGIYGLCVHINKCYKTPAEAYYSIHEETVDWHHITLAYDECCGNCKISTSRDTKKLFKERLKENYNYLKTLQ